MQIRIENKNDYAAVFALNASAFENETEAKLVEALRKEARPVISLVAEEDEDLVGHIMFTPARIDGFSSLKIMGLAPMAVDPDKQNAGIGSALVRAGFERCKKLGYGAVVVLGHPGYYPRFGFVTASKAGIKCEFEVPAEAFMVKELEPGYLQDVYGVIRYHDVFKNL